MLLMDVDDSTSAWVWANDRRHHLNDVSFGVAIQAKVPTLPTKNLSNKDEVGGEKKKKTGNPFIAR